MNAGHEEQVVWVLVVHVLIILVRVNVWVPLTVVHMVGSGKFELVSWVLVVVNSVITCTLLKVEVTDTAQVVSVTRVLLVSVIVLVPEVTLTVIVSTTVLVGLISSVLMLVTDTNSLSVAMAS